MKITLQPGLLGLSPSKQASPKEWLVLDGTGPRRTTVVRGHVCGAAVVELRVVFRGKTKCLVCLRCKESIRYGAVTYKALNHKIVIPEE